MIGAVDALAVEAGVLVVVAYASLRQRAVVRPGWFVHEAGGTDAVPVDGVQGRESVRLEQEVDDVQDGEAFVPQRIIHLHHPLDHILVLMDLLGELHVVLRWVHHAIKEHLHGLVVYGEELLDRHLVQERRCRLELVPIHLLSQWLLDLQAHLLHGGCGGVRMICMVGLLLLLLLLLLLPSVHQLPALVRRIGRLIDEPDGAQSEVHQADDVHQ